MKYKSVSVGMLAGLSILSLSAQAAAPSNAQLIVQIQKISQETTQLQGEVRSLKAQLKNRKKIQHKTVKVHPVVHPVVVAHPPSHFPFVTVTTSPWISPRTHFRPIDLLEQQGSMNEDLFLLRHRQALVHHLADEGYSIDRPMVQISGGVEGQAVQDFNNAPGKIALSTMELDINAVASSWANAFISMNYDSSPASTGNREPDGRIYLRRGFLTIGNLDVSPLYFSMGQMYLPFGQYSSSILTTPITESMGRVLTRTMLLGLSWNGFYGSIYGFTGDRTSGGNSLVKQGGVNLGIDHNFGPVDIDFGVGGITNLADSQGMQFNGVDTLGFFNGFGRPTEINGITVLDFENLRHNVPGADIHAEVKFNHVSFIAEYLSATRDFDFRDMTFNANSAQPSSLHTEMDINFPIEWMHFTLAGMYDESWQAWALSLPKESFAVALLTSIWKDTVEGIEFRHDVAYARGTFATGGTFGLMQVPVPICNGESSNMVTAQIGVYF